MAQENKARQHFRTLLGSLPTKHAQIARGLDTLMLGWQNVKPSSEMLALYVAVMDKLSPEQVILSFARASEEDWFPAPGRLVTLSGWADALDSEALRELLSLAESLHQFPMLQPKTGAILNEGRDPETDAYLPIDQVKRAEPSLPPVMAVTTRDTVRAMGDGDIPAGLRRITPAVPGILGKLGDDHSFELRQAEAVKRAWIETYRRVAA